MTVSADEQLEQGQNTEEINQIKLIQITFQQDVFDCPTLGQKRVRPFLGDCVQYSARGGRERERRDEQATV